MAEFAEIIIPVAAEAGFNFTVDDFKAAYYNGEGEASADELDAVNGGGYSKNPWTNCKKHLFSD